LAYGVKGLGYYIFWSDTVGADTTDVKGIYEVSGNIWVPAKCGNNIDLKTNAIRELNQDCVILAPYLYYLTISYSGDDPCMATYYNSSAVRDNLQNFTSVISDGYVELTEMEILPGCSGNIPPGDYFWVVNRDVENAQTIEIRTTYPHNPPISCTKIIDMLTNANEYDEGNYANVLDIEITLDAGCGRLYRATTLYDYTGYMSLSGLLTVQPGENLEIAAGCTVRVFNDTTAAGVYGGDSTVDRFLYRLCNLCSGLTGDFNLDAEFFVFQVGFCHFRFPLSY